MDSYCDLNEDILDPRRRSPVSKKPAVSYAALIAQALMDSPDGRLALPEIYAWIQEHYEYYREATPAWKNSIRHNLSMNRAFCKAEAPPNAHYKCTYWQFAVPTRVKIGSKGKATVSTTPVRPRSRSAGSEVRRVCKPGAAHDPALRRSSVDGVLPIRPRPDWMDRESAAFSEAVSAQRTISASHLNYLIHPDSASASASASSTVILLSSSGESPLSDELRHIQQLPFDIQAPAKLSWTPPPDDMQDAFLYDRDPLLSLPHNARSPLMR